MKIIAGMFPPDGIIDRENMAGDLESFIHDIDKLVVIDSAFGQNEDLIQYDNIEYAHFDDSGEAARYHDFMLRAAAGKYDAAVILKGNCYYGPGGFERLKQVFAEKGSNKIAVLTPYPIYTCMDFSPKEPQIRPIKGAHITGALLDVKAYMALGGFRKDYYRGYFDYEYCLRARLAGYDIILCNEVPLYDRNFRIISKKILSVSFSAYEKSAPDWYYETRNRHYLWDEYGSKDPLFVKEDKTSFKLEVREMRLTDPYSQNKLRYVKAGKRDYRNNIKGKADFTS